MKARGKTGLRKRDDWPEIARLTLEALDGHFLVTVMDKRLALAAKAFEYIFEPVLEDRSRIFYDHGLHIFVMEAVGRTIRDAGGPAEAVAAELRTFMTSFKPADAPLLFRNEPTLPPDAAVLGLLLRFARGYRDQIAARSVHLETSGIAHWILDLAATSFQSLLTRGLGGRHGKVQVYCDECEPLEAMNDYFEAWIDRPDAVPIPGPGGRLVQLKLDMAGPIRFERSIDHAGLQLADVVAGATYEIYGDPAKNRLGELAPLVARHLHEDHMLPDAVAPDPNDPLVRTHMHILRLLAARAELRQDPLAGMDREYAAALKRFSRPAGRVGRKPRQNGPGGPKGRA